MFPMNQTKLDTLSLDQLIRIVRPNDNLALRNHCMVAKFGDEDFSPQLHHVPCRVDAVTFWFSLNGRATLTCNMQEYELQRGAFAVILPNSVVDLHIEEVITEGYIMLVDPLYMQDVDLNLKKIISVMLGSNIHLGMLMLDPAEMDRMQKAFELAFATVANDVLTPFRDDVVQAMIKLMLYKVCEIVATRNNLEESEPLSSTRSEEYFRRFIKELTEHYMERQPVTFYAEQLCISSRYLTTIVRRVSGHTVTEWMNRYVMNEAKQLLKYSELSVQEIAYKLNFPNQSFFGKYFKQHAGISPSAYRQQ